MAELNSRIESLELEVVQNQEESDARIREKEVVEIGKFSKLLRSEYNI